MTWIRGSGLRGKKIRCLEPLEIHSFLPTLKTPLVLRHKESFLDKLKAKPFLPQAAQPRNHFLTFHTVSRDDPKKLFKDTLHFNEGKQLKKANGGWFRNLDYMGTRRCNKNNELRLSFEAEKERGERERKKERERERERERDGETK